MYVCVDVSVCKWFVCEYMSAFINVRVHVVVFNLWSIYIR